MSVPIHCPSCGDFVTETGWGDEEGEYTCPDCGDFRIEMGDHGMEAYEL